MLVGVPSADIPLCWYAIEPLVERCFAKAKEHRWNAADVYTMLTEQDLQAWVEVADGEIKTIVLTQLLNYPRARECNIFMWCGRVPENWQLDLSVLLEWARANGCQYASAMARRGLVEFPGWQARQTYLVEVL